MEFLDFGRSQSWFLAILESPSRPRWKKTMQLSIHVFNTVLKTCCPEMPFYQSVKNKHFAIGFSRFWEIIIMIFGYFGGPETHFGGLATHFEDFWDRCEKRLEKSLRGPPQRQAVTHFLQCCVFDVFSSVIFSRLLWFLVPRDIILAPILTPFWKPWDSEKTAESV